MMSWHNTVRVHDAEQGVAMLPSQMIQTCITSPPYFHLRDYGISGQIGQERLLTGYISRLVAVFRQVRRTLKDDGTLWLNLGDSYSRRVREIPFLQYESSGRLDRTTQSKAKDLLGIPWMVATALRQDGWYLRQDIIWHKPNPLPESVTDRCTKAHEYLFLLSKSSRYLFNRASIATPLSASTLRRLDQDLPNQIGSMRIPDKRNGRFKSYGKPATGANRRSVWTIASKTHNDAHLATFPDELAQLCILAGSNPLDTVLDPFCGRGTTLINALRLNRNYVGFDLNPAYVKIARHHLKNVNHGK